MPNSHIEKGGAPSPMGTTILPNGVNFALHCTEEASLSLLIFDPHNLELLEIHSLSKEKNKTDSCFHIFLEGLSPPFYYCYKIEKKNLPPLLLLDPYAKITNLDSTCFSFAKSSKEILPVLGGCFEEKKTSFSKKPSIPFEDLVIYEMHVRSFTLDPSSKVKNKGSFLGIIEKIPYLKELGVNAIELMPVLEWDEKSYKGKNLKNETLCNYWGYSPLNFFALSNKYGTDFKNGIVVQEFKTLIEELHKNGIEIILDVVLNHTGESDHNAPSLRNLAPKDYYLFDKKGNDCNFSGCGNTINSNNPFTAELLLESLRYFVKTFNIDGFRFDLAPILLRGKTGEPSFQAPLLQEMIKDPLLSEMKLIAEPWDAAGLYLIGQFAPLGPNWAEWNGKYRDCIRRFIKGDLDQNREFATRISGSEDIYSFSKEGPASSINFITCHDGFSLSDLVSYNQKHNLNNGENNRDGNNHNESYNYGEEGKTNTPSVLSLRERAKKNFIFTLFISKGVPMLTMGDEYGHTKEGNNNTWCQDNTLNYFNWDALVENKGFFSFVKKMIQFRKEHAVFRKNTFLKTEEIEWLNGTLKKEVHEDLWADPHFIAYILKEDKLAYFIAFNTSKKETSFTLPPPPFKKWKLIVLTSNPSPLDFYEKEQAPTLEINTFSLAPFSSLLLLSFLE